MSLLDTASLIVTPNGYKEGKLYSVIPSDGSGDLSVTRATTATRVNSQGLVELVPYNLVQYSEQFDNAYWTKSNTSIVANQTTAPNGTLTADKSIIDTSNSFHDAAIGSYSKVDGQVYTLSVYAKKSVGIESVYFYNPDGNRVAKFNLNNGAYIGNASTNGYSAYSSYTTETLANGWYRFTATFTSTSTATTSFILGISTNTTDTVTTLTGNGTDNVFIWGAQLVEGSVAKDYQKTETRLNIPRLDYSNGTCPSILVEPQRTNLLTYSENLTQWTANIQIASTQLVSNPLTGVNNATKITKVSGTNDPWVRQIVSAGNGTYTYSVYLWTDAGQQTDVEIYMYNASISEVYTLSITLTTTPTRYEFDATFANTGGNITARIDLVNSGDQYIYAYGAQLEAGSYATSYIPTTSASVTRNADVISKTGISSLIGQTEGTLFAEIDFDSSVSGNKMLLGLASNGSNFIYFFIVNSAVTLSVVNGGSFEAYITYNLPTNGKYKIAASYKANDFVIYANGTQVASQTSGSVPTTSILYLGNDFLSVPNKIEFDAAALWKTRLTNTQLAQLTTI